MEASKRKKAEDILLLSVLSLGIYFGIKKLFFLIFPIFLALIFSEVIRNSFVRLRPLSNIAKKILIVLTLMIFFATLSLLVILLTDRLIHGVTTLSSQLSGTIETITSYTLEKLHWIEMHISRILGQDMENSLTAYIPSLLKNFGEKLLDYIPGWIGSLLSSIPKFFFSLLIFTICTYYFSCDWNRITRYFAKGIKKETLEKTELLKNRFLRGLKQYGKAYILLFLVTFSELFLGFVCIRIPSPFEKALLVALVDILPIFGCGTVLIPWALLSWILGNSAKAIKLLILYLVILLIRQFLEPKIVGESIGLHPVLSLILVFAGLSLFGFPGMLLLPILATCFFGELPNAPTSEEKNKKNPDR